MAIRSLSQPKPQFQRSRLGWAIAMGAACLLLAGLVWLRQAPREEQTDSNSPLIPVEVALNVTLPSATQVGQWTTTLDAPLEQETKLVLRDATVAINTLARGFLPEELLASAENAPH